MTDFVFIDSGLGGIPYMASLLQRSPQSKCIYIGDTANFPYGEKTHEQVISCVTSLVEKICEKFSPSVIVLACNTMSVNALEAVRSKFPEVKFVGTVPAIKLAASLSKNRRIGLLATHATCENPYNLELKNNFASDCTLINRADPELISYIEHYGFTASRKECLKAVTPAVDFFRKENCDVIILGCTHFLNFTDIFEEACDSSIKVVDSVDGVVRHALEIRGFGEEAAAPADKQNSPSLYVTGFTDENEKMQYKELCLKFGILFKGIF